MRGEGQGAELRDDDARPGRSVRGEVARCSDVERDELGRELVDPFGRELADRRGGLHPSTQRHAIVVVLVHARDQLVDATALRLLVGDVDRVQEIRDRRRRALGLHRQLDTHRATRARERRRLRLGQRRQQPPRDRALGDRRLEVAESTQEHRKHRFAHTSHRRAAQRVDLPGIRDQPVDERLDGGDVTDLDVERQHAALERLVVPRERERAADIRGVDRREQLGGRDVQRGVTTHARRRVAEVERIEREPQQAVDRHAAHALGRGLPLHGGVRARLDAAEAVHRNAEQVLFRDRLVVRDHRARQEDRDRTLEREQALQIAGPDARIRDRSERVDALEVAERRRSSQRPQARLDGSDDARARRCIERQRAFDRECVRPPGQRTEIRRAPRVEDAQHVALRRRLQRVAGDDHQRGRRRAGELQLRVLIGGRERTLLVAAEGLALVDQRDHGDRRRHLAFHLLGGELQRRRVQPLPRELQIGLGQEREGELELRDGGVVFVVRRRGDRDREIVVAELERDRQLVEPDERLDRALRETLARRQHRLLVALRIQLGLGLGLGRRGELVGFRPEQGHREHEGWPRHVRGTSTADVRP